MVEKIGHFNFTFVPKIFVIKTALFFNSFSRTQLFIIKHLMAHVAEVKVCTNISLHKQ